MSLRSFISDAIRKVADAIQQGATATYPFISPAKREAGDVASEVEGLFQTVIDDSEYELMCQRCGPARAICLDFVDDALDQGFNIFVDESDVTENILPIYSSLIRSPLNHALKSARVYGFAGLLCYYEKGSSNFATGLPKDPGHLFHLEPIPKSWVSEILYKKDSSNRLILPRTFLGYQMSSSASIEKIDASRIEHLINPGFDVLSGTGESALSAVFDGLTIYKHNLWGAGQTMWRSGNQLVSIIAPPDAEQWMLDRIDTALLNLTTKSAFALPYGSVVEAHATSALDPRTFQEVALWDVAAGSRIPQKVLMGIQKGAVVGSETDLLLYYSTISSFQSAVIESTLLSLFKRLQATGQITITGDLRIQWTSPEITAEIERVNKELIDARIKKTQAETAQIMASIPSSPQITTFTKISAGDGHSRFTRQGESTP